jgi:hypothetical protein
MSDQIEKPRRRILSAYLLFWIVGAIFAAAYLALLGTHPEIFASSQSGPDIEQQVAQAQRDVNRVYSDIDPLKQSVGEIKSDVEKLKTAQQQASDRDQQLMDKIATIETTAASGKTMAQADAAAQPTAKSQHKTVAAASPDPAEEVTVVAPIKPQKTAAAQKSNAIETGSIAHKAEKAPAAPSAATTTAAAKPTQIGLLLGSAPSVDAVKLNWTILNDRHADAVRNLHPRYVASGKGSERTYALLAGPVASPEQAKTLCKLMMDRGLACEVSTYRGTAF